MTGMAQLARGTTLGLLVAALAACGSDKGANENMRLAGGAVKSVTAIMRPAKATAAQPANTEAMVASALRSNSGPLILAGVESRGMQTILGMTGENGGMRTYVTPGQQSLILRNGIVVGSRGFGNDLMSADVAGVSALIRTRRAGSGERTHRYLDGEGIERPLPLRCTVQTGAAQEGGLQVIESCAGNGAKFENHYLVNGAGGIVVSRQWIGPAMGHVTIQTVRP